MADDGGEVEIIDCSTNGTCDEDDGGGSESIQIQKSLSEESIDALQQLAIVVGVFLMVGLLFFLMVFILNFMDWLGEQWSKCCGSKKAHEDQESAAQAAALVGSFKRYK